MLSLANILNREILYDRCRSDLFNVHFALRTPWRSSELSAQFIEHSAEEQCLVSPIHSDLQFAANVSVICPQSERWPQLRTTNVKPNSKDSQHYVRLKSILS